MLKVSLKTARATGACWIGVFEVVATASDVLADFCRTYHLKRESCALFHVQGGKMAPKQLLRKIRNVPGRAFIQLTVEVQEPTLSFLLGRKWLDININAPTASDRQALSKVWYDIAMAHSSAATYAATAMSDMDTLLNVIQCKHTDILPASVTQPNLKAAAVATASAASRPLVLLIHAHGTVAASRQQQAALTPGLRHFRLEAEMKHLAEQGSQDEPSHDNAAIHDQSAMTALLRCATLLLKLVDLTPAKTAAEDATAVLWLTIFCLLMGFQEHIHTDQLQVQCMAGHQAVHQSNSR